MDLVLVTITGISLVLAIVMGLIVFKLVREERLRSEARVALLRSAVDEGPSRDLFESESAPAVNSLIQADGPAELFAVPESESPWWRRVGVAVVLALIVAAAGYIATHMESSAPAPSTATVRTPLELVALQHTRELDSLTISGTLLNPRGGAPVSQVAATAFVIAPDGSVLASGRAPLNYRTLGPGEESGFLIKIPVQGTVSRYRVGFRRPDGSVLTHVDRRTDGSSAKHTGSTENAPWVR